MRRWLPFRLLSLLLLCAIPVLLQHISMPIEATPSVAEQQRQSILLQSLQRKMIDHGCFIHPHLGVAYSSTVAGENNHDADDSEDAHLGVFLSSDVSKESMLLAVPHSLALTPDRAFEALSGLLTPSQMDALLDAQLAMDASGSHMCSNMLDWSMVVYVALAAMAMDHEAARTMLRHHVNPTALEAHDNPGPFGGSAKHQCSSHLFPRLPDQSFPQSLHCMWADMIALYPSTCVGAICVPSSTFRSVLGIPLLMQNQAAPSEDHPHQHQRPPPHAHIQCILDAQVAASHLANSLNRCPSKLPTLPVELMIWAASMVLSRQQALMPSPSTPSSTLPNIGQMHQPQQPQAALLPFFDLFNSHPYATNTSHPQLYRSEYAMMKNHDRLEWSTQARTQADQPRGSEVFDLYGGAHTSSNLDLLAFYGFTLLDAPGDVAPLLLQVCSNSKQEKERSRSTRQLKGVTLLEEFFQEQPIGIDQMLDETDRLALKEVDTATSGGIKQQCIPMRTFQFPLSREGLSMPLVSMARLAVATDRQLAEQSTLHKIFSNHPILSRAQDRASLLLLLHWLHDGAISVQDELIQLQCPSSNMDVPSVPSLTSAQRSIIRMDVRVVHRVVEQEAMEWVLASNTIDESTSMFQHHPTLFNVHHHLCRLKLNRLRILTDTLKALRRLHL